MTVPFENDTGNIVRKLARKSLKSEKRRNLMVVIAVALASCLICFSIVMALSTRQIEKNHVEDTYEAVYTKITEEDVSSLKGLDDFSRVGEYYMLAVEPAEQGYNASYIYCDEETMYIARDQMKLLEGRLPQKEDEVVVSRYFLSNYGADAGCALPGFVDSKNEEKTERNAGYLVVSHSGGGMLRQGTRKGIRRTPANRGMRAHRIVKSLDISEDVCHGLCP